VLGGGSGGRFYADGSDAIHIVPDSKNLPAEFAETRFPVLIEKLGLAIDSGGPGRRRGGLGYDKQIRVLRDAYFVSTADRGFLGCYGVAGGMAGLPYQASIDGAPLPGLNDDVPVPAGSLLRLRTTGGGGWGDPFEREPELVLEDVIRGLVSAEAAERDYGIVVRDGAVAAVTRPPRQRPFIDRGDGLERLERASS
jgi:N-methylhydantoinase B